MRLGMVIGRVTLSRTIPQYEGGRFLLVTPFTREQYSRPPELPRGLSPRPSPVIYDNLGGGTGDIVGYVEGREASMPFDEPTPVDALCVALVDHIFHHPPDTP
ncbi:MAG: ethanolamine utilization protein EutN [Verrucomicrobia bacterium]|nr:MAG: ethanolamine utilization protein EutN [Verrucomicrobiota bacterium]